MARPSNQSLPHKQILLVALAALLATTSVIANPANEELTAQVDQVFADLQKPGSPGCALGVFRNGKILYSKGYGLASIELDAPITPAVCAIIWASWEWPESTGTTSPPMTMLLRF